MKYTKEERLEIGKQIHESGISDYEASKLLDICEESARRYRILYEETAGVDHIDLRSGKPSKSPKQIVSPRKEPAVSNASEYESMTKEELIRELMEVKIRESRLKKGYMVKGVGVDKEYILLDSKNTR